jgi:hypothetical protein
MTSARDLPRSRAAPRCSFRAIEVLTRIDPASIKPSFARSFFIRPTRDGVSKDLFPEAGDNDNAFHTFHTFRYRV